MFGAAEGAHAAGPASLHPARQDNPGQDLAREIYSRRKCRAFRRAAEVIIEEGWFSAGKTFTATTLITKCPSKYQKQNRG